MPQTGAFTKPQPRTTVDHNGHEIGAVEKMTLRDVSYEQRRREAQEPLYLVRYE